jgi:hypothetical protein
VRRSRRAASRRSSSVAVEDFYLTVHVDVTTELAIDEELAKRILERSLVEILDPGAAWTLRRGHDGSLEPTRASGDVGGWTAQKSDCAF